MSEIQGYYGYIFPDGRTEWLPVKPGPKPAGQSFPEGSQQAPCLEGGNDGNALAAPLPSGDSETK